MKGIILAGGKATRLRPITQVMSKQLLPVYDKPMIYYPLSVLMLAGIKEILIITKPEDFFLFKTLLGDGSHIGIKIQYCVQVEANGLAQAFVLGEQFVNNDCCALALGDNIFWDEKLETYLNDARILAENENKVTIFGYKVADPENYGVAKIENEKVIGIEEKPKELISNIAITGLYFYGNDVCEKARKVKKSLRGEYEITDLNKMFLDEERLFAKVLDVNKAKWFDTGSFKGLLDANNFIAEKEQNGGVCIAYPEEISFKNKWINAQQLSECAKKYEKSPYGEQLSKIALKATANQNSTPEKEKKKSTPRDSGNNNQLDMVL